MCGIGLNVSSDYLKSPYISGPMGLFDFLLILLYDPFLHPLPSHVGKGFS